MRLLSLLALLAVLAPGQNAPAPEPARSVTAPASAEKLQIGSVDLTLGMEEKPTLTALRRQFHVERARGAGEDWAVIRDGETIAVVTFSQGKLSRASKSWFSTSATSATTMIDRLYSLASEFAGAGRTGCILSAKPYRMAGFEGKIVTLACGSKSIQFNESRLAHGGTATSLREVLQ